MNHRQSKRTMTALLLMWMLAMSPVRAAAWGLEGHRIVGRIASQYLSQTAKQRVLELLIYDVRNNKNYYRQACGVVLSLASKTRLTAKEKNQLLIEGMSCIAPWPDPPVKDQRPYTANWHFVDIPVVLKKAEGSTASRLQYDAGKSARYAYAPARDCATDPKSGDCAIQALERLEPVLGNLKILNSKNREYGEDMASRAEALKFIVHIIGDIHQPLHCVTDKKETDTVENPSDKGDLGGNLKIAIWFGETKTPYGLMNLHSIWDGGIISQTMKRMNLTEQQYFESLLGGLPQMGSPQLTELQDGDIFKWTADSYSLAVNDAYGKLPPIDMSYEYEDKKKNKHKGGFRLGEEYYQANKEIVDRQLRLGGVRLARILNEVLDDEPQK